MKPYDFSAFNIYPDTPGVSFDKLAQMRVDEYNKQIGTDDETGIHCELCHDKGVIAFISPETGNLATKECKCYGARITIHRLQKCGIWEGAKRKKLDNFRTDTRTQAYMKSTVERFLADPEAHWLMFCGQSGSGKTHLCTAAFTQIVAQRGLKGYYLRWIEDGRALKKTTMDDSDKLWDDYKQAEILYIDDMFKISQNSSDIRMAFEILDYRYINRLPTIISSELSFDRLMALDQAVASRIKEMCGPYLVNISEDPAKNYRLSHPQAVGRKDKDDRKGTQSEPGNTPTAGSSL